jgi:hypothetical protein
MTARRKEAEARLIAALNAPCEALTAENEALRQRAEAAEQERDTAKKYMAAYAECDRIGTEAYRDLADQHDALREKVSDMEAAWLVAHGVDLDSAMIAVQSVNATALTEARAQAATAWEAGRDAAANVTQSQFLPFDTGGDIICDLMQAEATEQAIRRLTPPADASAALTARLDAEWNAAIEKAEVAYAQGFAAIRSLRR